jgi:hypothetical protein
MKHLKYLQICQGLLVSFLTLIFTIPLITKADSNYGASTYGTCSYGVACATSTISITTNSNLSLTVNFSSSNCAISSDSVVVTTNNSTGYKLFLYSQNASSYLTGAQNINPTTGTMASPIALASNTWGYRVNYNSSRSTDFANVVNFGAGPSTTSSTFAKVLATNPGDNIINTSTSYSSGDTTSVTYGVCANTSLPSGSYTDTIIYTAATNP